MSKRTKILIFSVSALLLLSFMVGITYSLWTANYEQEGTNELTVGCFNVSYTNLNEYGGNSAGDISLINAYPITEAAGSAKTPYVFKIKNECEVAASYAINIETLNTSNFNTDYLRVKFNEASNNSGTSSLYKDITTANPTLQNVTSAKQLTTGYLTANEEVTYALRIWIDIDATTETPNVMGATWNGKVVVNSEATKTTYEIVSGDFDTVGSVVKIADEEFYVIGEEDYNHIKLLSKWNLNVGENSKGAATGLQDSDIRGNVSSTTPGYNNGNFYGNMAFSSTNYWYNGTSLKPEYGSTYPAWIYTNEKESGTYIALVAEYVDNYVTYLSNQGVSITGRLINYSELVSLGCSTSTYYCNSENGGTAPEWVYQTSYWSGTASAPDQLWRIVSTGRFYTDSYSNGGSYGIRPVIILEK